ncbi:MAG: hypothetical protein WCS27_07695 [Victivallaceae bacterium]
MLRNVTLELSLKPFKDISDAGIRAACGKIHDQWHTLTDKAQIVSIMFWTADGSEILDYKGDMNESFEWAKYIGVANPCVYGEAPDLPEEQLSIHRLPRLYMENPLNFTYGDLKRIVSIIKEIFGSGGKQVRVGTTFDPGPEFAVSSFKYERHPEILMADTLGGKSFVCCYAELNEDKTPYAGFPDGIKQGASLGTFIGRQARLFCKDLGFDYIWFSNGFGFGLETWGVCGAVFDGKRFVNDRCAEIKRRIFAFWTDFRRECPDLPVETRGTNLSTAMDLASDAVPLREIYREIPGITPPVNSPWAALNGDFGVELAGWMSHIAELPPGKSYPFRFYTHDPWFINTPWLDRYGRNPHDIYLPMSITRLDAAGRLTAPDSIALLSVDDSLGNMPEQVPNEVIPHLIAGLETAPDEPGPFIWLYPFDEYHDKTFAGNGIAEVFFGDWFMRTAINTGFPLNTVVSTANFVAAPESCTVPGNVIVTPSVVAENAAVAELLKEFLQNGGKVLFYGPAGAALQSLLQLEMKTPLAGELQLAVGEKTMKIVHNEIYSAGGIAEKAIGRNTRIAAVVGNGKESRDYAVIREFSGGRAAWVRGSNSFTVAENGSYPRMLDREHYYYPEELMRILLEELGWSIRFDKYDPAQPDPVIVIKKHANARYLATYVPDLNTVEYLGFAEGAPVFTETETIVSGRLSKYALPKAAHLECRVFLEMPEGAVKLKEHTLGMPGFKRRLLLSGLKNAIVRFRPEAGFEMKTTVLLNPGPPPFASGNFLKPERTDKFGGTALEYKNVSGKLLISW